MKKPKIGIFKLYVFENGHSRWFGAELTTMIERGIFPLNELRNKRKKRPKLPVWDLKIMPEVSSEKQLLSLIYDRWGNGRYMVIAFGGRANTFVFWKGSITEDGFIFTPNQYDRRELNQLKLELAYERKSGDSELMQMTKEIMDESKQYAKEVKRRKRYGFHPFLKSSGKRGSLILWNTQIMTQPNTSWGLEKKKEQEDWGRFNQREFEKW